MPIADDASVVAHAAPWRHLGFTLALIVMFLVSVTALYWWQITTSAARLREETVKEAELRAQQISSAVADQVALLFRTVDISARELANIYEPGQARDFDRKVKEIEERLPPESVLQIGVVEADGYLVYTNLGLAGHTFLGDREHIKVQRESGADRLFVSKPVLGRVSKQWSIQFTRPIRRNGKYAGAIVISVSPGYLKNALTDITLGSDDTVAIFRQSGEYLARNLEHDSALGRSAPADRPFVGDGASPSGFLRVVSNFDQTPRIYRWQRLSDYPITVVLGLSESTLLAPAERIIALDRRNAAIGTGLLWSFALAIALLFRNLARQQRLVVERSAQLRATLNTTPNVAIQWFDEEGHVTYWNPASERMFGWSAAEADGKTLNRLIHTPEQAAAHRAMLQEIKATGLPTGSVESRFHDKDGHAGWLLSTTFPIPTEGGKLGFVGMAVDITERKRAEDQLRASRQLLNSIIENIPTMIFLKRAADLRFELFNRAGEELLGMQRDQLLGRNDYDFFPKEQADFFIAKDREVLYMPGVLDIPEEPIETPLGTRILHTKKVALQDGNGQVTHLLGISEDITERRRAEAALREAKQQLEVRVAERTAQLEAASKDLAEFSYSVSHDLRSPLRAVAGFAKILEDDWGSSLGDEGRRLVRAIQDAGVRMGRLVDGLLDYLGLSRKPLQPVRIDMGLLAAEAYGQEAPADRKITFDLAALPPARGDAGLVHECMTKLLANSIRFTRSKADARIQIGATAGPDWNTYFVRDNGIGFDMQFADKLFCVFERLHSEPELTGTGIGLAMVKRIIDRHGGRVWADAKVGEGATFYFTLPSCER